MSRTIRKTKLSEFPDYLFRNHKTKKEKSDRKMFMYRGEGWSCVARGGIGNKRGWRIGATSKERRRYLKDIDLE